MEEAIIDDLISILRPTFGWQSSDINVTKPVLHNNKQLRCDTSTCSSSLRSFNRTCIRLHRSHTIVAQFNLGYIVRKQTTLALSRQSAVTAAAFSVILAPTLTVLSQLRQQQWRLLRLMCLGNSIQQSQSEGVVCRILVVAANKARARIELRRGTV